VLRGFDRMNVSISAKPKRQCNPWKAVFVMAIHLKRVPVSPRRRGLRLVMAWASHCIQAVDGIFGILTDGCMINGIRFSGR
jgi:hypothetical protein